MSRLVGSSYDVKGRGKHIYVYIYTYYIHTPLKSLSAFFTRDHRTLETWTNLASYGRRLVDSGAVSNVAEGAGKTMEKPWENHRKT